MGNIYNPINLFLETYNYDVWFESEESPDKTKTNKKSTHLPPMPPLEEDQEEVKEGKGLKILTPNKLLTRLPVLLAQIKAGNNQCNFFYIIKSGKYCIFSISKIISLKKFTTI